MGKRAGEFVTLDDVIDEVGRDATRYFYLMRRHDTPLEFDVEVAKRQSMDNPVYYAQYGHARCAAIRRRAEALEARAFELDARWRRSSRCPRDRHPAPVGGLPRLRGRRGLRRASRTA
jgi:arginyl-tRNA synthetase